MESAGFCDQPLKLSVLTVLTSMALQWAIATTARAAEFVDPLDQAAQMSRLAQYSQLIAIERAGERLVVAGRRGHILYSDDQGVSWVQSQVPVSVTLTDLSFPTPQRGWAVGHSGVVLHSKDGGEHWALQMDGRRTPGDVLGYYEQLAQQGDEDAAFQLQVLPINWQHGAEQPWLGVYFENDQHGFVVGPFNLIMETLDGGRNWRPWMHRVDNPGALHFNSIESIADVLYLPSEQGLVFRLKPGEKSFIPLATGYSGSFFGICGDDGLLLAYGLRGTVYASMDRGETWSQVPVKEQVALTGCVQAAPGKFLLSASSGQVVEITSRGVSIQTAIKAIAPWPLNDIISTSNRLVAVGLNGIWSPDNPPD